MTCKPIENQAKTQLQLCRRYHMNWEIFDSWAVREGVLAVTPAVKQE
jgi:hypothetical protein